MPRPRKKRYKDLPVNVYFRRRNPPRVDCFIYIHPANGKRHTLGSNRLKAIRDGKLLNSELLDDTQNVNKIITGRNVITFSDYLDHVIKSFWKNQYDTQKISERTYHDYTYHCSIARKELGNLPFKENYKGGVTLAHITDMLNKQSPHMRRHIRKALRIVFKVAVSEGYYTSNIANATLSETIKVKRKRLTLEAFKAIIGKAQRPELAKAMTLALYTLQQPIDLLSFPIRPLKKEADETYLYWIRAKTGRGGKMTDAAHMRIKTSPQIEQAVTECFDEVVSKTLLHYGMDSPKAKRGQPIDKQWVAKRFFEARRLAMLDDSELFKGFSKAELPTFIEIRPLGAKLIADNGGNPQGLLGHSDKQMTALYLSRHDERWTDVETMSIDFLDSDYKEKETVKRSDVIQIGGNQNG